VLPGESANVKGQNPAENDKSPATAKMSQEVMFDIPPRHFGKRWGDEIFTVALLYALLVICVKWSR